MPRRSHGMSQTPLYNAWKTMIGRCHNPNHSMYSSYGECGITVCERWRKFENFYADMGDKPSPAHSIDRKDNSAGYSQENCHWVTRSIQNQNRRTWSKSNSGVPGVFRRFGMWHIVITRHSQPHHIGTTDNFDEAVRMRKAAEIKFA